MQLTFPIVTKKLLPILLSVSICQAAPNVLVIGTHADTFVAPAINAALGAGHVDTDIDVDTTGDPPPTSQLIPSVLADTGRTNFRVSNGLSVNHAPYRIGSYSVCNWTPAQDFSMYSGLLTSNALLSYALGAKVGSCNQFPPAGTYPPVAAIVTTSPNSGNGTSTWGVEFGLSAGYLGLDTSADSWNTAGMAGLTASLMFQHPSWNQFDAKAAFRQTAGNWSTGYDHTNYGYGIVNYSAATALGAASTLYLQTPAIQFMNYGFYVQITISPFRQSRRAYEVIYSIPAGATLPVKNEYTGSDIAALGGTLVYTSNGTDVQPTFPYAPIGSGSVTVTFIAFTTDGLGNYSRAENDFAKQSITFLVGTKCTP